MDLNLIALLIGIILSNIYCVELNKIRSKRSFLIAEGTKWCGSGNSVNNCDDLGEYFETDKCCREHDHCPFSYSSNDGKRNGFKWNGFLSTISHCECDKIFWNCLSAEPLKETYSLVIRSIFFVGLNLKCFAYLPCNEDENEDEDAFFGSGLRRIGDCSNGIKVRAFQSIQEYDLFMQNFSSKLEVVNILRNSSELKNEDKHNATCYRNFKYLINDMIDSFIFNNNITLENSENQNKEIDLLNKKIDQVMERVDETSNSMNKVVFAIIIMCFSLIVFVIVIILIKRNSKKRKAKQPVRI